MIDLSPLPCAWIPQNGSARAGGGALLGDLDRESLPFGLVTTTGTVLHTSTAGWAVGRLTLDQLSSWTSSLPLETTAQGERKQNRSRRYVAAGTGVVTSFEYRLHPFNSWATGGHLVFPLEQARQVLRGFDDLYQGAAEPVWIDSLTVARA